MEHQSPSLPEPGARHAPLLAFLAYYALVVFGFMYVTRGLELWRWPFSRVADVGEAWQSVLVYTPLLLLALGSTFFLVRAGVALRPLLAAPRPSWLGLLVLAGSIAYAASMLGRHPAPFAVPAYWLPFLLLCAFNAVAEETMYRATLQSLLAQLIERRWLVVALQSLAYALPHAGISLRMTLFAFGFGLFLGALRWQRGGLLACVLCHFVVDLGAIGAPWLPR